MMIVLSDMFSVYTVTKLTEFPGDAAISSLDYKMTKAETFFCYYPKKNLMHFSEKSNFF